MAVTGLLLMNLGTPDDLRFSAVWRYLRTFLMDKRVINLPFFLRCLLVYGYILPFRVAKTRRAYQAIWTNRGSPLRFYGTDLCLKLQKKLGATYQVALGMRYGNPSIASALDSLRSCDNLIILPLYPQYSSAATGSSMEAVLQRLSEKTVIPPFRIIDGFYDNPGFIQAQSALMRPYVSDHEMIVFSYHGLPQQHLQQSGCALRCEGACPVTTMKSHALCYRAQCYETTRLLAEALHLDSEQYCTVFQSRLGRTPWIQPYMDQALQDLAARQIKRIAVVCPSFVADCLETLEEIGIRAQEQWLALGGEQLSIVPCLNAEDAWCEGIMQMIKS